MVTTDRDEQKSYSLDNVYYRYVNFFRSFEDAIVNGRTTGPDFYAFFVSTWCK
jgi:hypothetical protein